jgi:cytochrome c-type biogenesis protein CcmH
LLPDKADLWSLLGEARFKAAGGGVMPPEAVAAFQKALAIDPGDPVARYHMGIAKDLAGDHEGAIADWLALLADTPPGSSYEPGLRQTIEQVGKINKIETASRLAAVKQPTPPGAPPTAVASLPGPTAQQVQDAARLSPSQQMEMGRGMTERLEGRLKANPADVPRWIMLIRSRMQLKEPDKAKAALRDAIAANPEAKAQLEAEARDLGVPGT